MSQNLRCFIFKASPDYHHISSICDGHKINSSLLEFTKISPFVLFKNWNNFPRRLILITTSSKNEDFARSSNLKWVLNFTKDKNGFLVILDILISKLVLFWLLTTFIPPLPDLSTLNWWISKNSGFIKTILARF